MPYSSCPLWPTVIADPHAPQRSSSNCAPASAGSGDGTERQSERAPPQAGQASARCTGASVSATASIVGRMSAESHLLYEARVRPRQAVVAGVAGILLLIAAALQLAGPQAKVSELTVQLISLEKRFPLDVIGGVVQGIALLAVIWTLSFLFDAVRARRPEISPATRVAVIGGGLVSAIGGVIYAAVLATKAH